jgi:hypothetical protein
MTHATRLRVAGAFHARGWLVQGGPCVRVSRAQDDGPELTLLLDPPHIWHAEGDPQVVCEWIAEARQIFEDATR